MLVAAHVLVGKAMVPGSLTFVDYTFFSSGRMSGDLY
jgi:hypothetical protein